jgi:endonuclease/exonuclease/phosphatase family metal-dependent hydrolase
VAEPFSEQEWAQINAHLDANPSKYGMPARSDRSVVMLSWNIRKFGAFEEGGVTKKSPGAFAMIERVCGHADLIAIQEVQRDTGSLYELRDRLRAAGTPWDVVVSDVTGMAPGYEGMAERHAILYRSDRVKRGDLASDLSFDRSAVLENSNDALRALVGKEIEVAGKEGILATISEWLSGQKKLMGAKLKRFVQFIRTPHIVEFVIEGPAGAYEFYVVNAHLVSGDSKTERELEFFALLEWLLLDSRRTVAEDGKTFLLMADLNLDFQSSIDKRRAAMGDYLTSINEEKDLKAKVNFPFLDGEFYTNARRDETFDHIAWITTDTRLPRGRHNDQAGQLGPDQYAYGMFDFVEAFSDAGPGRAADGNPAFDRYTHDFTDHMPIWVRLPVPADGQADFTVVE